MKKTSFGPIKVGKVLMVPVSRHYRLSCKYGMESVRRSIDDAIKDFGAIYQGETDIRHGNGRHGVPHESGYCNFLIPVGEVNAFNAHWNSLEAQDTFRRDS